MIFWTVAGPSPVTLPSGLMMLAGGSLARPMLMTPAARIFDSKSDPVPVVAWLEPPQATISSVRPTKPMPLREASVRIVAPPGSPPSQQFKRHLASSGAGC